MISPHHIINTRKKKLEDLEKDIDQKLNVHFQDNACDCHFPLNEIDITNDEINSIVMKYHNGGWIVKHEEGCNEQPCGSCWNYIKFSLPRSK